MIQKGVQKEEPEKGFVESIDRSKSNQSHVIVIVVVIVIVIVNCGGDGRAR